MHSRTVLALAALATLGVLLVVMPSASPLVATERFDLALRLLLLPLGLTMIGVARARAWGRWMALAGGVAVLPWAAVLTAAPGIGGPPLPAVVAGGSALVLVAALLGRGMRERFEGAGAGAGAKAPGGWRMALVRATLVLNGAAALNLYLFVAAYRARVEWRAAIPALTLLGLLAGLGLLARQKTAGLLLVAASCLAFLPAGAYFAWAEATSAGEAALFAVLFLPGIVAALATLAAFGGPILRHLRG